MFAISDSPEAASGEKPRPIRIAPVTATGVPKPDAPSKKAPKAKAMRSSCRRRSGVTPPMVCCSVTNTPFSTVSRYRKMTLSTIQPMGKKPTARPSIPARTAMPPGMVKASTAIRIATTSAITAAMCALTLPEAISASSVTTGRAATRVDRTSLENGL